MHPATFGCPEAEIVDAHEVTVGDGWLDCSVGVTTRNPDADGVPASRSRPDDPTGYHYRVELPYRTTLEFAFPDGMRRALHEVVAPNEPDRCTVYWALLVDERLTSDDEDELTSPWAVFAEDQPIIESQPPGVPVDRRAEIHVPADRLAVAYLVGRSAPGAPEGSVV